MKTRVLEFVAFLLFSVCGVVATAQELAYAKNDVGSDRESSTDSFANDEIINFIVTSAAARIISADEGKFAAENGTTPRVKQYGELMVKDQGRLLGELKRLAVLKNITIPEDTYENILKDKSGKQLNNAFIRTMIAERERDIELFKKAAAYGDPDVSAFATKYLPLLVSHLKKIKSIK